MKLGDKQREFARCLGLLIVHIYRKGYQCSIGDVWRPDKKGHIPNSKHYSKLAADLNLFKDGKYLSRTEDHRIFGEYWEGLGRKWGGRFRDGNHYEF